MRNSPTHDFDVAIVGAGPVGLFLACELRLRGVSVLLLEQALDPTSPFKQLPFGMRGLSVPTMDALNRRGLLDKLKAQTAAQSPSTKGGATQAAHWMQQPRRPGGHFAGIQFFEDNIDSSKWPYHLPQPAVGGMATTMEAMETVLESRARELGADIRRGLGVQNVNASMDGVALHAGEQAFNVRWLVGCDGGRSSVRKLAGFEFVGTAPEFTGYSVEIEMANADALAPGRHYTPNGMYTYQPPGTIAMVDFDGGAFHRTQAMTQEHVESVLRRVSGAAVNITAVKLATTWTDRAFQATAYRKGRVLLAGDAAHIHSPLGGQGLNLGVGDAMNLGWKLAATILGEAPEGLLDSYHAERHPVGAQILDWSRAQVGLMRPSPSSRALEAIIRELIDTRDGASYFAERVWGLRLRYELGDSHPLVGRSAPEFEFNDGSQLAEHLQKGQGLLVDFGRNAQLKSAVAPWHGRIAYAAQGATERLGLQALLVRPDGVVAWASDADPDAAALAHAASKWFGRSAPLVAAGVEKTD